MSVKTVFLTSFFNQAKNWSYTNPKNSPELWPTLYPTMCAGFKQSPIEIISKEAHPIPQDLNLTMQLKATSQNESLVHVQLKNLGYTGKPVCFKPPTLRQTVVIKLCTFFCSPSEPSTQAMDVDSQQKCSERIRGCPVPLSLAIRACR